MLSKVVLPLPDGPQTTIVLMEFADSVFCILLQLPLIEPFNFWQRLVFTVDCLNV